MLSRRAMLAAFAAAASAGCAARVPLDPAPDEAAALLVAASEARVARGLAPLARDPRLAAAADAHARDMARHLFIAHRGSDGGLPATRLARLGYPYAHAGENIAVGQRDAAEVVAGWLESPGHRAVLLRPEFVEAGAGFARSGRPEGSALPDTCWVLDMGYRRTTKDGREEG